MRHNNLGVVGLILVAGAAFGQTGVGSSGGQATIAAWLSTKTT